MAARGNKARKKDKRRRHAKSRKLANEYAASLNPSPARRGSGGSIGKKLTRP